MAGNVEKTGRNVRKTEAVLGRERRRIRTDLLKMLDEIGRKGPVCVDLVDTYLEARDRMIEAQAERRRLVDAGVALESGEICELETQINGNLGSMASILNVLQVAPKSKRRTELEAEIRSQLCAKGLGGPVFEDRIDTFLKLWDAFQEAVRHLNAKGRTYFTISSAGKQYEKDNAATKDIVTMAKAMQDILDNLDINVKGFAEPEDDDL